MKIYPDMRCLKRPFDEQSPVIVAVETAAVAGARAWICGCDAVLQQFGSGRGDYTAERDRILRPMTDEEVLAGADRLARDDRARRAAG